MKRSPLTITIAGVLIVIFGLMLFVFTVRKSEVAVVTIFGKLEQDQVRTNPGPYFRLPWPIENVYRLDQRIHSFEDKFEPVTLPDQNQVQLLAYVGWRIADPFKFFPKFKDGSVADAESTLETMVRSAKLEVAGKHNFFDFLSANAQQMKFTQIEDEMLQKVQQKVASGNYGIEVKFLQIKSIGLPQSVTQSVFDRMKSERNTLVTRISADALEQAIKIKSDADSGAAKLLAEADARAKAIRGEGEAQMVQSLQVLRQNPPLATFIMDLDMLEEMSKEKTTWVLDHTTPGLELLQNTGTSQTQK